MEQVDDYLRGLTTARLIELAAASALDADPEDEVRWAYVRELQRRPEPGVFAAALAWCADADARRRILAADLLGQLGYRERERPYLRQSQLCLAALVDDPEPEVIAAAVTALSHFPSNLHLARLHAAAAHRHPDVRCAVAVALAGEPSPASIETLITLCRDDDGDVRNWATFALGSQCEVDTPALRQALCERLAEPDSEIRGEALVGLARRADARVVEPLAAELEGEVVGSLAIDAATAMPSARYLPALEALAAAHPDDGALAEAIRRCRQVGTEAG